MTTQISEIIIIDRKKRPMLNVPLEKYQEMGGTLPETGASCSALWRGYVGTWAVQRGRLFLVDIDTTLFSSVDLKLEDYFPGCGDRVFAEWFSDTLCVPQGKILKRIHGGFGAVHEEELQLKFECGVLVSRTVKRNHLPDPLTDILDDDL